MSLISTVINLLCDNNYANIDQRFSPFIEVDSIFALIPDPGIGV